MTDLILLVHKLGYVGLFLIVFFESFPLTFFLPGDSLLFTTGFLASQGVLDLHILIPTIFVAGTIGYIFSYILGKRIIKKFFTDENARWFKPKYVRETHAFYDKYGAKTIIIGRFVPIVRSFGPALAGLVEMHYGKFLQYTILGGAIWSVSVTVLGFYLGKIIPDAEKYITPVVLGIIVASLIPTVWEYYKKHRQGKN
jgi:membrane-associated protein